ncbi:MAG: twin-arginine translocase TatA/TatE family subunit [Mycobacterium leprae]
MFGGRLGFTEVILIVLALLVIWGPSKLPELGKSLGKGIREFKGAVNGNGENGSQEQEKK